MLHNVEASAKAALGAVQDNVSAGIHNALQFVAGADPTGETVLISGSGSAAQCSWAPAQTSALSAEIAKAQSAYTLQATSIQEPPKCIEVPKEDQVAITTLFSPLKLATLALNFVVGYSKENGSYTARPDWDTDAYFVEQRTFGVNPCALTIAADKDVQELFPKVPVPAPAGTKYYVCDYKPLVEFSRQLPDATAKTTTYIPAPVALFKYDGAALHAVAILVDRAPTTAPQVIYNDGTNSTAWRYAKMAVRVADWNIHELGSHLTLAHIVNEVACVATYSSLPQHHPIFQLLLPHFFRTLPLNSNARSALVPVFIASKLSALNTAQAFAFCASIYNNWDFQGHYVPADLARRDVASLPASVYPFATTAKAVWATVHDYVDKVLAHLTALDAGKSLLNDFYLKRWIAKMHDTTPGFPETLATIPELADALTMIIYTPTHQHSAVNYFQRKYMTYLPSSPGYLKTPPPADISTQVTEDYLQNCFPSPHEASVQAALVDMLSDEPEDDHRLTEFEFKSSPHYVAWPHLKEQLDVFQSKLQTALAGSVPGVMISNVNLAQSVLI